MRICIVGKYPPIEGGVSAQTYWTARGLAARGHEVHVVTNAFEVSGEYRIELSSNDEAHLEPRFPETGGSVRVVSPAPLDRRKHAHIPMANPFVSKLAGAAAAVVEEHGCEAIITHYLEPYGVAAHLAALWTGVPLYLRHAGSDLDRLMRDRDLATTYRRVLTSATAVVTSRALLTRFLGLGVDRAALRDCPPFAIPDDFSPDTAPMDAEELSTLAGRPVDPSVPMIGVYGKPGRPKAPTT
ncbi:glycosyltransferase [Actinokineospora soli]|uniref:Glycosyltransferase n=1 Tax=Actinokineospora soli TaxID=1048753 RepID=A0ABW2TRR4_9PSEU